MCMLGDFLKECLWNNFILAPVKNFFTRGKVKEEVQHGVDVAVNAAEQGLQQLDEATSGAVSSIADELSKAGVDLSQFKHTLVEAITDDAETAGNKATDVENQVVEGAGSIATGVNDEFQNVQTQTEVAVEKVKSTIADTEKTVDDALKKTGDAATETVSSVVPDLANFGAEPVKTNVPEDVPAKKEETSPLSKELKAAEDTVSSGIQNAEEAASTTEKKVEEGLLGFGDKIFGGISSGIQNVENAVAQTEETLSGWSSSLLTKEKDHASDDAAPKNEEMSTDDEHKKGDLSSGLAAGVEKVTQGLSSIQETLSHKKEEIDKIIVDVDDLQKETVKKKKEVTGFSSDLHFLRETVAASKDIVVETFNLTRSNKDDEQTPPEPQSAEEPISNSSETEEEKPADTTEAQNSKENNTKIVENTETEMGDNENKKEASPIKEVSDFLKQEISDASKHIEEKKEEVKQEVSEVSSAVATEAQVAKHSLFDSLTDIGASITNTIHNIETGIEHTGKDILTGVGTSVKEAGDFIAGTEEDIDDKMDDKELKVEAVTSLLDKSLIN